MAKNGSKNDVPERRDNHELNQTGGDTILPGKHDQIVGDWIYGDRQQSQNEEPRESNAFQNNKTRPRQEHQESQQELEDKDRAVRKAAKHESKAPSGDSDTRREQDLSPVNSGAPGRKPGGDPRVPSDPYAGGETPPYRPTFIPPADMQRPGPPIVPGQPADFHRPGGPPIVPGQPADFPPVGEFPRGFPPGGHSPGGPPIVPGQPGDIPPVGEFPRGFPPGGRSPGGPPIVPGQPGDIPPVARGQAGESPRGGLPPGGWPPLAPGAPSMRPPSGLSDQNGSMLSNVGRTGGESLRPFVDQLNDQPARRTAPAGYNPPVTERESVRGQSQSERSQPQRTLPPDSADNAGLKSQRSEAGSQGPRHQSGGDNAGNGRTTADNYLPSLQLTEHRPPQAPLTSDKSPTGKLGIDSGKANGNTGSRHGDLTVSEKHAGETTRAENPPRSVRETVGPRSESNPVPGIALAAVRPGDGRSGQVTAGPTMVPAGDAHPDPSRTATGQPAHGPVANSSERRTAGSPTDSVSGDKSQSGNSVTRSHTDMAGATRHEPKPTGADVNNNPATGSDKRAPAAGESGTMRTEGRLDSADKTGSAKTSEAGTMRTEGRLDSADKTGTAKPGEAGTMRTEGRPDSADKIGTAKTGPRAELPGDKVGQAPSTSPRTDAPTGKASTLPVDQTKLPTTKQPSPVGQPAPDFPVVLPPRFTPFNLGIMGNTGKPEPGACDRKGADIKTGNGLTQPGTAGGPTIKEGLVQSGRTGNPADASDKVVQSDRGERNEGMVQPGRTISTSDTSGKAVKPGRSGRNEGLVQPGSTDNTSDGSGKIVKPGRSERNEGMVQSGRTGNTADAAGKVVRPGRNDRHEGMTQSDRTGQTAGSSGNVVKAVRSEPNDGRAETATRAIEQIHSGNRQSESRAGREEKPTPAKDRRVEETTTMSDVQLQGLAVRLFGDLQAKLSSFVQSIKDSARRAQPDQAAPNEITAEQRNVSMLPKPSDIRLKGPGAPAESTTAYTYARPADKDATDALIAFVKANRSLLDGVLEPNAGTNELLKELVKLVQEIDCGDAEQNMPDADADVPCFDLTVESDAFPTSAGRAWYIVRAGETLDSIAEDLFNDARISYVLYEINKAKLPATITDGAITRDLIPGTVLYLPTASEIRRFLDFYSNARAS